MREQRLLRFGICTAARGQRQYKNHRWSVPDLEPPHTKTCIRCDATTTQLAQKDRDWLAAQRTTR